MDGESRRRFLKKTLVGTSLVFAPSIVVVDMASAKNFIGSAPPKSPPTIVNSTPPIKPVDTKIHNPVEGTLPFTGNNEARMAKTGGVITAGGAILYGLGKEKRDEELWEES